MGEEEEGDVVERPFYTRSAWETDQRCRRARYWNTEYRGQGVEPNTNAYELNLGTLVHGALAEFLQPEPQDEAAIEGALAGLEPLLADKPDEFAAVERCTLEGMLRGWLRVVRPPLLERFSVLQTEQEVAYEHHGTTLGSKPDTILRERHTGLVVYVEWKTTRNVDERWLQSWHRQPQLVAGIKGVLDSLGVEVDHAYVVGLYKGYTYRGEVRSPYAVGWRRLGERGFEYAVQRPTAWKGWDRFNVWQEPGGLRWWVNEALTVEQLAQNFVWTTPITPDRRLVEGWLKQSALREIEIQSAREASGGRQLDERELDRLFPQNFGACEPAYGFKCPYLECCWLTHVGADPVGSGIYRWRQPHHKQDPMWHTVRAALMRLDAQAKEEERSHG